jgi:signal transduction histidine kinase
VAPSTSGTGATSAGGPALESSAGPGDEERRVLAIRFLELAQSGTLDAVVKGMTRYISSQTGILGPLVVLIDQQTQSPTFVAGNEIRSNVLAALEKIRITGGSMTLWRAYLENRILIERDWRERVLTDAALAPMRPFIEDMHDLVAVPLPWEDAPIGVIVGMLPREVRVGPDTFTRWWKVAFEAALALQYSAAIRGARHVGTDHERLRLKEELHDTVSQRLFGLSMLTARAQADAVGQPELHARLTELRTLVADASTDIHLFMGEPPPPEDAERLSTRLATIASRFGKPNNLQITLELDELWDTLSENCTEDVVRITRECLRNVVKHAQAMHVSVRIPAAVEGMLLIEVADDGTGFDPRPSSRDGFGLDLINERALERGGNSEVHVNDQGTTIRVRLTPEFESDWQLARRALETQIQRPPEPRCDH